MDFGAAVRVLRVAVNVGNSLGSSGIETNLAPTMTVGTGYFGRSSVGENLQPKHLVNWTRVAYNSDLKEAMADFAGLTPWAAPQGPVPAYPVASNAAHAPVGADAAAARESPSPPRRRDLREEIRRLIVEELHDLIRG